MLGGVSYCSIEGWEGTGHGIRTTEPSTYLLPRNGAREALWSREHFAAGRAWVVVKGEGGAAWCNGPRLAEMTVVVLGWG